MIFFVRAYFVRACVVGLLCLGATVTHASPEEDARLIADRIVTQEWRDALLKAVRAGHARALAGALVVRNVQVRDIDQLAARLPSGLAHASLAALRQETVESLLRRDDPDTLAEIAAYLLKAPGDRPSVPEAAERVKTPADFATWERSVTGMLEDEDVTDEMRFSFFAMALFLGHIRQFSPAIADLSDPWVPDLLQTQSELFFFPNRIWRNDLIRELRRAKD